MADLGSVGFAVQSTLAYRKVVSTAVYAQRTSGDPSLLSIDASGRISGVVRVSGVAQPGVSVGLFYRSSMRLIARATTAADGSYSFDGLNKSDLKAYFIVALDPNQASPYLFTRAHDHLTAG